MKQKFLLLVICSFITFSSFAQFSVKGGVDFSSATTGNVKSETGFHFGGAYDVALSKKIVFQPSVLFSSNGFSYQSNAAIKRADISMYAVEIPLVFSYRPHIGKTVLLADAGLYTRYNLFGSKDYEYADGRLEDESPFDVYNRFDMGLNFGIGLSYHRYFISGTYQRGFTNIEKGITNFKRQKLRISIGYYF